MFEARERVAQPGPFDVLYELGRCLATIFRFCIIMGDLKMGDDCLLSHFLVTMLGIHGIRR